ncbi:MAG TPA: SOS response-associated peptidase [Candidatus Cloacimonadota bacterium]|nr:SOS response-associated peptidase [Candidatus Cloacimonadota bacterium]
MCGRFAQIIKHNQLKKLMDELEIRNKDEQIEINYNVAPSQPVGAVIYKGQDRFLTFFRWGLIPAWSKEPSSKFSLINVRAETILEKPTFKNALLRRRCLIPATGFYEWRKSDKQPFFIYRKGKDNASENTSAFDELLFFAGITEYWNGADGSYIQSCAIITTAANATILPLHDRMPVILTPELTESWLREDYRDPAGLKALLKPCPDEWIDIYPVSKMVSSTDNNSEECLKPISI